MADETARALAREVLELVNGAFAGRLPPASMTDSMQLSDVEFDEVMSFQDIKWQDVTFEQVERNSDAVFWFSPEAFRYYLPGFLAAGLKEGRTDANAYDALIGMLDRSPEPAYWDDFFAPRWTLLGGDEVRAVAAWVAWFAATEPGAFYPGAFDRALATLRLLEAGRG